MMDVVDAAWATKGFMPRDEGLTLHRWALAAPDGHLLEIGSYCGRSAILIGAAAAAKGCGCFTLDHHRGSEEHQPGEGYHDPGLTDPCTGLSNTLPCLLEALAGADLTDQVTVLVGESTTFARFWTLPLSFVFIDGGHSREAAHADLDGWSPHLIPGGLLAIHDVFPDPADGGRPPFEIYERALASGGFMEVDAAGSLRLLRRR